MRDQIDEEFALSEDNLYQLIIDETYNDHRTYFGYLEK